MEDETRNIQDNPDISLLSGENWLSQGDSFGESKASILLPTEVEQPGFCWENGG